MIRLARGQQVRLLDGAGHAGVGELVGVEGDRARLRVLEREESVRSPERVILLAIPRHALLEEAIQLGAEGGVTRWLLVRSRHSPAGDPRADRLERVARAAITQCGRPDLPAVLGPLSLTEALADPALDGLDRWIATAGGARGEPSPGAAIAIGPEGGWVPDEVEQLAAAGFRPLGLGPWTLRNPTAVAAALGALWPGLSR